MASAQWAGLFKRHGHESYSISIPDSPLTKRLKDLHLPHTEMNFREYVSPLETLKLRKYIVSHGIEAVFLQSLKDLWVVSPALIGLPTKLIGFAQMWLEGIDKKDFLHGLIHRRMDHLITLTPRQSEQVLKCIPYPKEKTLVIPNSINPEKFSPNLRSQKIRSEFGAKETDVLIGIVGRLDRQKGQREAIESFAMAKKESGLNNLKLVLVGDSTPDSGHSYLDELKKTAADLQVTEHIYFAGFRADVPAVMASLDIFLLNSYREAFGFVVVEAMMSGTAVIATNSGGIPDVLGDGRYGLLVPPRNTHTLATSFTHLARDANFRKELGDKARIYALNEFDEDKNFLKLLKLVN